MSEIKEERSYHDVYRLILNSSELLPLSKFKSSKSASLMYPDAHFYPDFFNHNLLASGRIIKVVKGKSALLKAFYYQLMKLTFQIEVEQTDYVELFKSVIFHPALLLEDHDMQSPRSGRTYTDKQYKRILVDFIELIDRSTIPNFEFTVMEYPIIDEALLKTFQALLAKCFRGAPQTQDILQWLSEIFSIQIEKHGRCYKFKESDIFLYEETREEYYLSFLNEMAEVSDYSESMANSVQGFENKKANLETCQVNSMRQIEANKEAVNQYQLAADKYRYSAKIKHQKTEDLQFCRKSAEAKSFASYGQVEMEGPKDRLASEEKKNKSKIESLLQIMSIESRKNIVGSMRRYEDPFSDKSMPCNTKGLHQNELNTSQNVSQITPKFFTNSSLSYAQDHYNPFNKTAQEQYYGDSYQKEEKGHIEEKNSKATPTYGVNQVNGNQISTTKGFFQSSFSAAKKESNYYYSFKTLENKNINQNQQSNRPTQTNVAQYQRINGRQMEAEEQLIYKPISKTNTMDKVVQKAAQQGKISNEDSKGSLYRQFTDTKVLAFMDSLERRKVNNIRKRYRGKHRRDLISIL